MKIDPVDLGLNLRTELAARFMAALLSNPSYSSTVVKEMAKEGMQPSDFLTATAESAIDAADELIKQLNK